MTVQRIKSGGLFIFGGGCIGLDRIKTNNQERIINNPSNKYSHFIVYKLYLYLSTPCIFLFNFERGGTF